MNLYPRLCSSFLRFDPRIIGTPYRRISLLISQVDVSRRSVIHIDPLSPSPRPRSQPAGPVSVGWIIIPAFRSALSTSLGAVLAPRTALCPFRAASATCREYFRCSPANLTPFARVLANFPCPALCPLRYTIFGFLFFLAPRWKLFVVSPRRENFVSPKLENFSNSSSSLPLIISIHQCLVFNVLEWINDIQNVFFLLLSRDSWYL